MSSWQRRVDELLYESETVEETVDVETARVVVTSHRVLSFTPEMDGENFTQVERPNVTGVGMGARGNTKLAGRSVRYGIYGVVLVLGGLLIDSESYVGGLEFDAEATSETGAGGIVSIAQAMLNFMARFDELMQVLGALLLLAAVVMFAVYWLLREPTLTIAVAGEEADIHVPRPTDTETVIGRLEAAVLPDGEETEEGTLSSMVPEDSL